LNELKAWVSIDIKAFTGQAPAGAGVPGPAHLRLRRHRRRQDLYGSAPAGRGLGGQDSLAGHRAR
jgi:hypothetical protein